MFLAETLARCLAKTPAGKPNGCAKADRCQRHVVISSDRPDASPRIEPRLCGDESGVHAHFIALEDAAP